MGWFKNNKMVLIIIALSLTIIAGAISFGFIDKILKPIQEEVAMDSEDPENLEMILDHDHDENSKQWLNITRERNLMIVIDNDQMARPQAGLNEADLVYEVPVEGGRARFMTMYSRFNPQLIGPIRSARSYNIDLALQHDAIFIHAGGSPLAFNLLASIDHLNGLAGGVDRAFWRKRDKDEPHNLYSDSSSLRRVASEEGITDQGRLTDFQYLDEQEEFHGTAAEKLAINYGDEGFRAEYLYNNKTKRYIRFTSGVQHKDLQGRQLTVKNIIVQIVKTKMLDEKGRLGIDLDGQGKAVFFVEGQVYEGFWKNQQGIIKYFKTEGEEIALRKGNTWVNLVPSGQNVTY